MEEQQKQIICLTKENETAKSKLLKLQQKHLATKAKSIPDFVNSTLAKDLDSDSDIQELGNSNPPVDDIVKVTTTTTADHNSDSESVFQSAQKGKWRRRRIESGSTVEVQYSAVEDPVVNPKVEVMQSQDDVVAELQAKKEALENKCREMSDKLLEQKMDNAFRDFQDEVREQIGKFRHALMSAYGKNVDTEPSVVKAREDLCEACETRQFMGHTLRVSPHFVDRVQKSLLSGQVPEHQYECKKTDNSVDDPIQGHVIDVVYEITMPVVIKSEAGDDEDCEILGFSPPSAENKLPLKVKVKEEPGTQESQDSVQSPVFGNRASQAVTSGAQNLPLETMPATPGESVGEDVLSQKSDVASTVVDVESTSPPKKRKKDKAKKAVVVLEREL